MVVKEEWFDEMNVTDGVAFPKTLIKRAKTRVNQKIKYPHITKRHMQ